MKRRDFSLAGASALSLSSLALPSARAQGKKPEEGTDYLALDKKAPVDGPSGKIEVTEFFWYSCPHCNAFEPAFDAWAKRVPKDVVVRRVPVAFRDDFVPEQRLYYVLEALGKLDELHRKAFYTIHVDKQKINTEAAIVAWLEKQGLAKAQVQDLYKSFSIQAKATRARQIQDAYKVQGVPALGIGGRFYTDGSMAGSMERALQVADHLIEGIRKGH